MKRTLALVAHAAQRLAGIDGLELHGTQQAGVVAFVLRQQPAAAVAAVLDTEFGIDVQHSHGALPDRVWLHLGPRNTFADIEVIADALQKIARGEFEGVYIHDAGSGAYVALGAPPRPPRRCGVPLRQDAGPGP
jgi:selenocysteine lyase/cysteine desulfurase